ncbi:MAG TPA: hypothetical protein VFD31_04325 [Thermoleophilaceae bacterium]|nr:hypothetical protein [Thermoleophilaceae bacterium]
MSEPAVSIAFFDPEHGLHGSARSGTTLLFEGSSANVLPDGPAIERDGDVWRAKLEGAFSLTLAPVAPAASLGGVDAHLCAVTGEVGGRTVSCLGTVGETHVPPSWDELEALRSVSAVFDRENAFLALARRPLGAAGHDAEQVTGWLLADGEPLAVENTRLSTVYDGDGRQRSAGLELWLPGEDYPRRGSGTVVAGSSLQLDGLAVHAAIFRWRMADREGTGAYELWVRPEPEAA